MAFHPLSKIPVLPHAVSRKPRHSILACRGLRVTNPLRLSYFLYMLPHSNGVFSLTRGSGLTAPAWLRPPPSKTLLPLDVSMGLWRAVFRWLPATFSFSYFDFNMSCLLWFFSVVLPQFSERDGFPIFFPSSDSFNHDYHKGTFRFGLSPLLPALWLNLCQTVS